MNNFNALPKGVTRFGYTRPNSSFCHCPHFYISFTIITRPQQLTTSNGSFERRTTFKSVINVYHSSNINGIRKRQAVQSTCSVGKHTGLSDGAQVIQRNLTSHSYASTSAGPIHDGFGRSNSKIHQEGDRASEGMGQKG